MPFGLERGFEHHPKLILLFKKRDCAEKAPPPSPRRLDLNLNSLVLPSLLPTCRGIELASSKVVLSNKAAPSLMEIK